MKIYITLFILVLFFSCNKPSVDTIKVVIPIAPTSLNGVLLSNTKISLSWTDNSTNEEGFKIERKTTSTSYFQIATISKDITSFTDSTLSPNTQYNYRVYSYNSAGSSATYSNELSLKTLPTPSQASQVVIGTQQWMKENLDVSTYRNGDIIPQVTDATKWGGLTTGAWCYYNNDSLNGAIYGKLYNWYAVNDPRGLALQGWHIPTDAEWTTLSTFLGGDAAAGGKMKTTGTTRWTSPNASATNESGFTALPGGFRNDFGTFNSVGYFGYWWSATEASNSEHAWYRALGNYNGTLDRTNLYGNKRYGFSIRCIRD